MEQLTPREKFQKEYGKTGIKIKVPLVDYVKENKHGMDNPVIDLNIRKYLIPIQQQLAVLPLLTNAVINNDEVVTNNDEIVYII